MKKSFYKTIIIMIVIALPIVFVVGCKNKGNGNNYAKDLENTNTPEFNIEESLAFSAYMAGDLLELQNINALSAPLNATQPTQSEQTNTLDIETDLEVVNIYFNKLKLFLDRGVNNAFNFVDTTSDRAEYDNMLTFNVYGTSYTVYYNYLDIQQDIRETPNNEEKTQEDLNDNIYDDEDLYNENKDEIEQEFQLSGIIIIDDIEYELKGANETEDDEKELWLETTNIGETNNFMRIERKTEQDEQKFEIKSVMDGVIKETEIKFENSGDQTKVELKLRNGDGENQYEFKRETEAEGIKYKFEYQINQTKGEVKIYETQDEFGNSIYRYKIEEEGKNKEIDKDKLSEKDNDDDDEDDDEDEDEENE